MSKRGENIYKRKDGRWEGRYDCRVCCVNIAEDGNHHAVHR